jgi:hypothetical protein
MANFKDWYDLNEFFGPFRKKSAYEKQLLQTAKGINQQADAGMKQANKELGGIMSGQPTPPPKANVWDKVDAGIAKAGRMARGKKFMAGPGPDEYQGLGAHFWKKPASRKGRTIPGGFADRKGNLLPRDANGVTDIDQAGNINGKSYDWPELQSAAGRERFKQYNQS